MAVDFSLLKTTSSATVERPKPLPEGHYIGTISNHEFGVSKVKQTPFVRFQLVPEEATGDVDANLLDGIDLSKRELRRDFYITPKSMYRICDMLDAVLGKDERMIDERIPETRGARVMFGVTQRQSEDGADTYNDVTTIVAAA